MPATSSRLRRPLAVVATLALLGCGERDATNRPDTAAGDARTAGVAVAGGASTVPAFNARWLPTPPESSVANAALLASVRRGRAILAATNDSLPDHVGNDLRCTSCHLDNGTRANSMPWVGIYGQFPQYRSRAGEVLRLEDRINGCMLRSMNGSALPLEHPAMRDMVAYIAFLSRDVPVGGRLEGQGLPKLQPTLVGDTLRGRDVYARECARCHAAGGEGTALAPALWGDRSFNIGAGMSRLRTAAAFVKHNMPYDRPGTLSDQAAFDVAAWLISRPRPDLPGKERDWPNGDAPPDAAYPTRASAARAPR